MLIENKKWPQGIRKRILFFTIIVTLIPSLGLGWLFYSQTQQLLLEKVELELNNTITHVHQEMELWIKKSSFNLTVFSNSFVITENLEQLLNSRESNSNISSDTTSSIKKITDYLSLVQAEFDEYKRLILLDNNGEIITQSSTSENSFNLPDSWREQLQKNTIVISEMKSNEKSNELYLTITVPILSDKNKMIGLLAIELTIEGVKSIFRATSIPAHSNLLLLKKEGLSLFSTNGSDNQSISPHVNSNDLATLLGNPMNASIYTNMNNEKVIGITATSQNFPWNILVEKNYDQAFTGVIALKKRIFMTIIILISIFSVIAYLVSQSILSPLKQLVTGANKVASGDLDFKLTTTKNDELGFAISIFNDMVRHLRHNHEEKEKMLRIDSLTGLHNRKHMMETLDLYLERYHRNQTPFSIFMADLDYFKQINDNHGHQNGDAVLVRTGAVFNDTLRSVDVAGRYGGEEFIIILDETEEHDAIQTAERIRNAIEECELPIEGEMLNFTISIGVATISNNNETKEHLISKADKALYQAKMRGRNCVCSSGTNIIPLTNPVKKVISY